MVNASSSILIIIRFKSSSPEERREIEEYTSQERERERERERSIEEIMSRVHFTRVNILSETSRSRNEAIAYFRGGKDNISTK